MSTSCSSNAAAFGCYPYTTYAADASSSSAATFDWIIEPTDDHHQYAISSSDNPFAPSFANVTLSTLDAGRDTERLAFSVTINKAVVPAGPLVPGQASASTCYFNETVMSATMWTRAGASYPAGGGGGSSTYQPWPYAVEVSQVQRAGAGVPDCRGPGGGSLGGFGGGGECGCWYANVGLGGG